MEKERKKMRSFRGCRGCKSAKRRCTEEKPICSACAKAGRECQVLILLPTEMLKGGSMTQTHYFDSLHLNQRRKLKMIERTEKKLLKLRYKRQE